MNDFTIRLGLFDMLDYVFGVRYRNDAIQIEL